jgi:hypothetical protein
MLNNKIENKNIKLKKKDKPQLTWINLPNLWPESWHWDNHIESKSKKYYEAQFPTNTMLKDKIKKSIKKKKKNTSSQHELTC